MKPALLLSLVLALVVLIASPLSAQEERGKKKREANASPKQLKDIENKLSSLELKEEQKKKVDDILASYKKRFADTQAKGPKLAKEQRQTQKQVAEKARAEGKKGKQLRDEVAAALNLTEEQKKQRDSAGEEQRKLVASLKKDLSEVLTPEQAKVLQRGTKKDK